MAKLSNKYFFSNYWRFKIPKKILQEHVPGLYLYFTPVQKFATQKKKHDDGTGLVKMQEDPRSSTCCLLHHKVLPFGG
jgi:hypothetical protein